MDAKPFLPGTHSVLSHDELGLTLNRPAPDLSFTLHTFPTSHMYARPDHAGIKGVRLVALGDVSEEKRDYGYNQKVYWIRDQQTVIIGRAPQHRGSRQLAPNTYALPCPVMSREHAIIEMRDGLVHMTDSNSHHGTWCLGSSGITERIKQPRIVQDGEIFTFGKIVEKNGQLYHPAKVSIKLVYDDVYPDEEAGIANGYDDVSQGAPHTNRYGLLDDEMSDVDSIYNDSAEHTPSQFVSHFADGFLDVIGNDGPEEPSGAPPCNPCSPGSPSPILSSSCYSTGDVDRQVVLSKPVSSIRNLLHYDYDLSHEPSPAPSPSQHEEDMIMSGSEASDSESSESEDSLLDDFYPQQLEGPFVSGKVGDMKESLKVEVASTTPHTEKRIADLEKKLAEVAADLECTFRDNRMVIHEMEDERSELLHELEHLRADAVDMKLEDISGILLDIRRIAAEHQTKLDTHLNAVHEKELMAASATSSPVKKSRKRVIEEVDWDDGSEVEVEPQPATIHVEASAQADAIEEQASPVWGRRTPSPPVVSISPCVILEEALNTQPPPVVRLDRFADIDGPSPAKRARIEIVIPSAAGVLAGAVAGGILTWAGLAYA